MLFDLRSRRRRRVIKVVYLFLAVLIGVGLVGFGVGTGGNFGGLFNAASGSGSSSNGDASYLKALNRSKKAAARDPNSPAAWLAVGEAAYNLAELPSNYVVDSGFTKSGFAVLPEVKKAWNSYIALDPAKPSNYFASEVALVFGLPPSGIKDYVTLESAQEIVAETDPTYTNYLDLCDYAYSANEPDRAALACQNAIAIAPKSQKKTAAADAASYKATYDKAHGIGATGASGVTSSTSATSTTSSTSS
jgi:tetratricopeptide (TPR) repeat protein